VERAVAQGFTASPKILPRLRAHLPDKGGWGV